MNFLSLSDFLKIHLLQGTAKCNVLVKVLPVVVLLYQVLLLLKNAAWEMASGLMMEVAACGALVCIAPTGSTVRLATGAEG